MKYGWTYKILSDIKSRINYNKKGLYNLLNLLLSDEIERLIAVFSAPLYGLRSHKTKKLMDTLKKGYNLLPD